MESVIGGIANFVVVLPPVFALDLLEDRDVANGGEEQYAGAELDDVAAKDVVGGVVAVEHRFGDFYQSVSQYWMGDVCICLFTAVDAVEVGNFAMAQAFHLREYIPHTVSTLMSGLHFL